MLPAREVLALPFVWRTLRTAAMTANAGAIRRRMCRGNPSLVANNPHIKQLLASGHKLSEREEMDEYRKIVR
jgi:hypothetical protein